MKKILLAIPELRMFLFKHESTDRKGIFEGHICATQLKKRVEREREREEYHYKKKIMKRLKI